MASQTKISAGLLHMELENTASPHLDSKNSLWSPPNNASDKTAGKSWTSESHHLRAGGRPRDKGEGYLYML